MSFLIISGPLDDDDGSEAKRSKSDSPASVLTGTPPTTALTPGLAAGAAMPGVISGMAGIARPPFGVVPG